MGKRLIHIIACCFLCMASFLANAQVPDLSYAKLGHAIVSHGTSVVSDNKGNAYVTGTWIDQLFLGNNTFTGDGASNSFVVKLDSTGNYVWSRVFGGDLIIRSSGIDANGYIYACGYFKGTVTIGDDILSSTGNHYDVFVMKLDTLGYAVWGRSFPAPSLDQATSMYTDRQGNSYVTGTFRETMVVGETALVSNGGDDIFIFKIDADGNPRWARSVGGTDNNDQSGDIAVDAWGDCYVTGAFRRNMTVNGVSYQSGGYDDSDVFILKFGPQGEYKWVKTYGGSTSDYAGCIATDPWGNFYVAGAGRLPLGSVSTRSNYIAKSDRNGNWIWEKTIGNPGGNLQSNEIAMDAAGNSYLTGFFSGTMTMGTTQLSANGTRDAYAAKFDRNGQALWAMSFGGPEQYDAGLGICVDSSGHFYLTGEVRNTSRIGNLTLSPSSRILAYFVRSVGEPVLLPNEEKAVVRGKVYQEDNGNCQADNGESLREGLIIKATPGPFYAISTSGGTYDLELPVIPGTATSYSIRALPANTSLLQAESVCPPGNEHTVAIDSSTVTLEGMDFGYNISECQYLQVHVASNRRVRCFKNQTTVRYSNAGSLPAENAYVLLEFPRYVVPLGSNIPGEPVSNNTYRYDLGTIAPGQSGHISILDSVLCGDLSIMGLTQCTRATIYPIPDCRPDASWNGAAVGVSAVCENQIVHLKVFNKGTADMTDSSDVTVYLDSLLSYTSRIKLAQGDTFRLDAIVADGQAVHIWADQVPGHPFESFVTATISGCTGDSGDRSPAIIGSFPLPQTAYSKVHCMSIRGAYDPNDKQVVPSGFTDQHIVYPGTELEYLIRFQNTGTDTAYTVFIIDTLSSNLDAGTLEMGAASHSFELSMQTDKSGKTFLRWQFNNIMLPDSSADQVGSNGFVQFRIKPEANLPLGSTVRNNAEIYFDFNPPVITNQTLTTYDTTRSRDNKRNVFVPIITTTGTVFHRGNSTRLYPNPSAGTDLRVDVSQKTVLSIFNSTGQLLFRKEFNTGTSILPLDVPAGIYFAKIESGSVISVEKIIVHHD